MSEVPLYVFYTPPTSLAVAVYRGTSLIRPYRAYSI